MSTTTLNCLLGNLQTPIVGHEILEARSKHTVYKINVKKAQPNLPLTSLYVFRRYSEFFHLKEQLKSLFPTVELTLPPKRFIGDNFDKDFLEVRKVGLQQFLNEIIGFDNICNSEPVREFLSADNPPGPHDSLEGSKDLCSLLEKTVSRLNEDVEAKGSEIDLLKREVELKKMDGVEQTINAVKPTLSALQQQGGYLCRDSADLVPLEQVKKGLKASVESLMKLLESLDALNFAHSDTAARNKRRALVNHIQSCMDQCEELLKRIEEKLGGRK